MKKLLLLTLLLVIPAASAIQITEIMYDLEGSDAGREWIEVYVDKATNFEEWRLYEAETNHRLKLVQGSFFLEDGDYFVIIDKPDYFAEMYPDFSGNIYDSSFSLSNKGEVLILRNDGLEDVHAIKYSSDYGASGDGNSLQRSSSSWISCLPTPGAANCKPETSDENEQEETTEPELEPEDEEESQEEITIQDLPKQNTSFDSGAEEPELVEDSKKEESEPIAEITASAVYQSKSADSLNIAFWLILLVSISFNVVFLMFVIK